MPSEISFEMAQALDLKRAVWRLRVEDHKSITDISDQLRMSEDSVTEMLKEEYAKRQTQLDDYVAQEKIFDLERINQLMAQSFKVAKVDGVKLQKIVKGEVVEAWDPDVPQKAVLIFLQLLDRKAKILGYEPVGTKKDAKPLDSGWLRDRQKEVRALLN